MIKDITIGQYLPGDSFIHKLDPRVKILLAFLYIILIFLINNFYGYLVVIAFTLLVVMLAKIPIKYLFNGIKGVIWLIIFTAVLNATLTPGKVIFKLFNLIPFTDKGIDLALFMSMRLILLIVGTSVLTLTTSPISLTDGIERLLNPFKKIGVPAHELAMMMTIALRFIPTLLDETDKIMKAQMARGADFDSGGIIKKAKNLIPVLVPLFISAFRRADELALAMEARCYRGGENRTRMKQLKTDKRDYIAIAAFIAFSIICIISRRWR
ncbi:energy-coupling factor transporter transmembrane component T family protein [Caloramator australicus]|uniref:Energy-coupling factor transporter transmembrane protein EcfT n=1 Tax=Caloramator australicus RC3 TaxID=857293 RepID=I7KTW6_9CLOT|nr:energy-coupling factor transporter transmembrane component T [Caloramator australicus]CCJ33278.1 Transmembrane component of general energizing module of ECF transporters [Caloramator australicus RC3]